MSKKKNLDRIDPSPPATWRRDRDNLSGDGLSCRRCQVIHRPTARATSRWLPFDVQKNPATFATVSRPFILSAQQLTKSYGRGSEALTVLKEVSFDLGEGETLAIVGPSGSGKTTLLGLCAGLDKPTSGDVSLAGRPFSQLDEDGRARVRNELVGFIFQNFQLLPSLTALENVMVPLELRSGTASRSVARNLLEQVGLGSRTGHYPTQLSGGEQQRVALARAFATRPKLLFADEPTGNLDDDTAEKVVQSIFDLNSAAGTALVLVTHDLELAARCQRTLRLKGGRVLTLS